MFLFLSNNVSRKARPLFARAFSSTSDAFVQRSSAGSKNYANRNRNNNGMTIFPHKSRDKCYSTTTGLYAGAVEQDLDSALDDLLQGTFDDVEMDGDDITDDSGSILKEAVSIVVTKSQLLAHGFGMRPFRCYCFDLIEFNLIHFFRRDQCHLFLCKIGRTN